MKNAAPLRLVANVETMTNVEATSVKEQARALGTARTRQGETDAATVAGDAMDRHGVPLLRLILSTAALLIIYVDPAEPDRHVPLTYAALALYALCSGVVYVVALTHCGAISRAAAHWIDLAWHTLLVSLSGGTNSLFFPFYFFDILVASFRCGAAEGYRVTIAATLLYTSVGYASAPADTFELNRFLLRCVSLPGLGYMVAYWGGLEDRLKRRLALLKEVTVLSNPRFGAHQTIASALEKLRRFYDADRCLLVIADGTDREHWLYQTRRGDPPTPNPERCARDVAALLLRPPSRFAMLVRRRRIFSRRGPSVYIQDLMTGGTWREPPEWARIVVSSLDADSIATVPFQYHHEAIGRLYVTGRAGLFDLADLNFLSHAIDATLRVTDNVRLIDRLATDAAEHERSRIARGIHDTVIQPYIGLQLGLRTILESMKEGDGRAEGNLERLLGLIDAEVARLRHLVTGLKGRVDSNATFMPAVTRFAHQFAEVTGIEVSVKGPAILALSDRLGAELFEMTAEALSNVRRHTQAHRAAVIVERTAETVVLTVENDGAGDESRSFDPRSLKEHAQALGGCLDVHRAPGTTAVVMSIPL